MPVSPTLHVSPTVHVIDDCPDVCRSLAVLLGTAGIPTRTYLSARAFLDALPQIGEGCVVTDVSMPGIDGLELQRHLKTAGSRLPVIMITAHGDVAMAVTAMREGARDFIEKPFNCDELLDAVTAALDSLATAREERPRRARAGTNVEALSPREREVLGGLVAGQSNKAVGHALGISPRTVEVHRANIMAKMGARSLSDLVRMFVWCELDPA